MPLTSWIQNLRREQLEAVAQSYQLDITGTVDDIRRRVRRHVLTMPTQNQPPDNAEPGPANPTLPVAANDGPSHSKVMNQIRKWGCHFDGRDPLSFLERIAELQEEYRYTDDQMKAGLPELLKGDALAWYRNERDDWETWADFTNALRRQYLPRRYQAKLVREIQERRQQPKEPYAKYATALQTMMRRAGGFTQAEKVDRLYENLRAEYKLYVRLTDATDLADLAEQAAEYEDITKAQEAETRTEKHKVNTATTAESMPYDRANTCWRCKQRGHDRFNCKRPARKFCSQCGKDGVLTKDCHPRPGNAAAAGATTDPRPESA
jgi:hypothetical protein